MSSALFFVWVNLAIALSFAAAMLAIALLDNRFRAAFWFAGSFFISALYLIFELATAEWSYSAGLTTLTLTTFMVGLALINVGLSIHYNRPIARWVIPLAALVAAGLIFTAQFAYQNSLTGYIMYQAPLAAMQSIGAWVILSERRAKLDRALGVVFVLSCAHFLAKPFIALATGRFDNASVPYLSTDYAAYSQALGTVIGVALALLIIVIMVQQLLTELKRQALTDGLSGLLNRAAFHHELSRMVSRRRRRAPMALIICDLDHFKAINDTYGHECGDQVIAEFAATICRAVADEGCAGRIGGEEFAILLEASGLGEAMETANRVRIASHALRLEDFPDMCTISASFGVVEIHPNDSAQTALSRADLAMYRAKAAGRDCVRTAPLERISPPSDGDGLRIVA